MEVGVILATLLLLIILFFILRLVVGPLKILSRLLVNCGIAFVVLIVINFVGSYIGIHLPINPVSVIGIGLLGVPGLLLFAFLSYLFI